MPELLQNTKINDFTLDTYLGAGQFGEVWKATDTNTQKSVAVKFYVSLDQKGRDDFFKEYQLANSLKHKNLLSVSQLGEFERRPYLVMDYCEKGAASKLVGTITSKHEKVIWQFIKDVAAGLTYLHSKDIVHQDIKPENILQTNDGGFVIADFGISTNVRATMRKQSGRSQNAGATAYMAPERFKADPMIIKASDIWSLGVSIYELAIGKLPFSGMGGIMQKNGAEMPEIVSKGYSKKLNDLMQKCLALEPWDRIKASEIVINQPKETIRKNNTTKIVLWSIIAILLICISLYIANIIALRRAAYKDLDKYNGLISEINSSIERIDNSGRNEYVKGVSAIYSFSASQLDTMRMLEHKHSKALQAEYCKTESLENRLKKSYRGFVDKQLVWASDIKNTKCQTYLHYKNAVILDSVYAIDRLNSFKDENPIIIKDIEFCNVEEDGTIIDDYGSKLYASEIKYLKPRLEIMSFICLLEYIYVKVYIDGIMDKNLQSPEGYTYSNQEFFKINDSSYYITVKGWGNASGGYYSHGNWRFEFWYKDKKIGEKSVTLY